MIMIRKSPSGAGRQWLTLVILATQEAEIRRIMVCETLSRKNPTQNRAGRVPV
jgi:hypothetical protein